MKIVVAVLFLLTGNVFADTCEHECSRSITEVLARDRNYALGDPNRDFKDYCAKLGGTAQNGVPMHCHSAGGYNWYCTKGVVQKASVREYGSNLMEARKNAREACRKSFVVVKENDCASYIPGSQSHSAGKMECK